MKLIFACLLILVLVVGSACAKAPETPADSEPPPATTEGDEAPPPATTEEDEEAPPSDAITEEDVEAARQVVFAYLEALNNYDVEGTLAFLEESWRQEREESITNDINEMETFGVKLGIEEEAEPAIIPEGKVEIKIKLITPMFVPDRHATYHLTKINGEWKICFSEAVEE